MAISRSSEWNGLSIARAAAVALLPTFVAFAIDYWVLAPTGSRWLLMIAAVIVSAANGGMVYGLVATIASTALVWWFLIPPRETLGSTDPVHYLSAAIFVAVAFAVSLLHERLRRTTDGLTKTMHDLTDSQRILQGVLDHSPNVIVIKDIAGRFTIVNNGFVRLTGMPSEVAIGKTNADLFTPEMAGHLQAADERVIETRQPVETEEAVERNGRRRVFVVTKFPLLDDDKTVVALCSIWTDITQRKFNEEALRRVANDLRIAQHVAHVGSWRWDVIRDEAQWSDELYHIFGLEPTKDRRAPLLLDAKLDILTEHSRQRLQAAIDKTLIDGTPYELDLEFKRPDGSIGWISGRGEPVLDRSGRVVAINGTSADITKVKELQRVRDEWTSVIAHDLRQPIGTILMASSMLPELIGDMKDDARAMVQRINTASHALKRMVNDLLDMSLLEAQRLKLERKWIKPAALMRETIQQLAHLPGIDRVHPSDGDEVPAIFVDPMRVQQVLVNLVSNALKYGDTETDVAVRVEPRSGETEFLVTNRGQGISAEELPRLFNRFTRSKAAPTSGARGLGLGLYIAKGIVDAHGGRIWAESVPGGETTFHVVLPKAQENVKAA